MKKLILILLFLLLNSTNAWSLTIYGDTANSVENLGNFIGELTYSYHTDNYDAQLIVELTNTSVTSNGGFITAFAFTNPNNSIGTASLAGNDFGLIGDDSFEDSVSVAPFDSLDFGGALGNSWLGGGNPKEGIAVGETETFTFNFNFSGTDLSDLAEIDFLPAAIRFKGFDDNGSDKVPASTSHAPEPATMVLFGFGLIGLAGIGRRKQNEK